MSKNIFGVLFSSFLALFSGKGACNDGLDTLEWNRLIHLDAEDLAEEGIKEKYDKYVVPELKRYIAHPAEIEDIADHDLPKYQVKANSKLYLIYDEDTPGYMSWGYATYAIFDIVNQQLSHSDYKFYAFYNGNDLEGIFLSQAEYKHYFDVLSRSKYPSTALPYIPTPEPDWFGQHHD